MSSLFHYTSNEGAIGIINSACLFATHYEYLNDVSELSLAKDIVVPIFERELRMLGPQLIAEGRLDSRLLTDHGENVFALDAKNIYASAIQTTDKTTPVFITSFCRHPADTDHARNGLLSQWRGYGSSGGCALEFEEGDLT
jgi:hypothetical protein